MRLTYRFLEDLLADLHEVAPQHRIALRGRIKHFQRNGWPGGTNTGKGRAASYDFGAVMKLCLGFELLQIGVSPERATKLLRENWDNIRTALSLAINSHPALTFINNVNSDPFDVFLYCDPRSLMYLSDVDHDPSDDNFFYVSAPQMARQLEEYAKLDLRRLALINLSTLLDGIYQFVGDAEEVKSGYEEWDTAERAADQAEVANYNSK